MSRVAKQPIPVPKGVDVNISGDGREVKVKGAKGELALTLHDSVQLRQEDAELAVVPQSDAANDRAMAGTMRALVANMVTGVSDGFERKLQLVGVGYRAQAQGQTLNLSLGFSHPVEFAVPQGVTVETPVADRNSGEGCR